MKLETALPILESTCQRPFRDLFPNDFEDLRTNKGKVGQLLLRHIGLPLDSNRTDFDDGELKTNFTYPSGLPKETMWIMQIDSIIDTLVATPHLQFKASELYKKIRNLVYLPVVKTSDDSGDWYFTSVIHVLTKEASPLFNKLEHDYEVICRGLVTHIETSADGFIHTTNGPNYLQIRSKDSTPNKYKPIYSSHYSRYVSNKNHGFYFLKTFMKDAVADRLNNPPEQGILF